MRPLDRVRSIKAKLGIVIVAAICVTAVIIGWGHRLGVAIPVLTIVGVVVGLAMVQLLARGMTSPLREMVRATRSMARGDYSKRVTASSRDEVGELARAFNSMAAQLAEVDQVRRDLVANVSHELRTPISALQAVLENLVDGVAEPDPRTLTTMLAQVQRLGRLVSQLLDLSRLEAGVVPFEPRDFPISDVFADAIEEARLQEHAVHFRVEVTPPGLLVHGDPERVHQVVANLIANAVNHSPEGATIDIGAARHGRVVALTISDEGPGVAPEDAVRIFERFHRVDASRTASDGGSGLGLAIARWIVDLHGGSIRPEDREPNGCRMVVELPLAAA